jgi:hypothetical protein
LISPNSPPEVPPPLVAVGAWELAAVLAGKLKRLPLPPPVLAVGAWFWF